jgi:hypothetical protein
MLETGGDSGRVISRNFRPGLSINRRLGLNQLMSLSAYYENTNFILQQGPEVLLKNISYNYITVSYDYNVNTLDLKHFPDRGTIMNISASLSKLHSVRIQTDSSSSVIRENNPELLSFDRFLTIFGNVRYYFSPTEKLTVGIGGDVLLITDTDTVSSQNNFYLLGGIESLNKRSVPLIGFFSNEIPVNKMAGIRTEIDMELFRNFHVNLLANTFWAEEIMQPDNFSLLTGYGIGLGYMSIIGPLKIGLMNGSSTNHDYAGKLKGFFSFGYNF